MAQAKVIPFDIYPEITKETIKLKKVYDQQMIDYKKGLSTKPAPIHPCAPNPMEIHRIATLVNNPRFFQLYDHGHTTIFHKNKPDQIIADIHFTDLSKIDITRKDKVDFLLAFLRQSSKFVNTVASPGKSSGGSMWAIGWRKSMTRLEIIGRYLNKASIRKNCDEFKQHIKDSEKASEILWDLFYNVRNKALEKNQHFKSEHDLPAFSITHTKTASNIVTIFSKGNKPIVCVSGNGKQKSKGALLPTLGGFKVGFPGFQVPFQTLSPPSRNMTSPSRTPQTPRPTHLIAWNRDGGEAHPPSIRVLLDWLERDNNYERWRQDTTKVMIRREVVAELKAHGIGHRSGTDVNLKICMLEQAYLTAHAIQSQPDLYKRVIHGKEISTAAHMRMICEHWSRLHPLMGPFMTHADDVRYNIRTE
ncbi:hypothetical protein H4Q26_012109 [Puccinia striiformis f. sp. tritici PST-130]|nr:hypothetical protein H4Q26_012109 [Puccinia striiformis f. sp. tritici PST-130]